ncbi:MAG: GNAT family N-acetyltransferase [Myxococcota bacterium]|nr:GNAT family N-acetyltransferase [Myxococcota bacterium]
MRLGLALATELELAATCGTITDRGDYLVVRTNDPSYYFGNILVLASPPQVGEVAYWTRRFADEFRASSHSGGVRHVAFRWDGSGGDPGARDELRAAGFSIEDHWVMASDRVAPAEASYPIRALRPDEMEAAAILSFAISDDHSDTYRHFLNRRAAWKADLVIAKLATFWGAFDGSELVGSLGLVPLDRVARYQDVQTAATHRKRGIASALLATAAAAVDVDRYVIVADPESDASRIYTRAGFTVIERMVSAFSAPASR